MRFVLSTPSSVAAGSPFAATVTAQDATGQQVTDYAGTIHFTSSDPGAPVLPTDYTFTPSDSGAHTFASVELHTAPSQSITAGEGADPATNGSRTVTVTPGAATRVGFTQQPGGGTGGVAWGTQPKVTIQDSYGNTVTSSSASVTLAILNGSGTTGAVLTCAPKTASSGVATFTGCKIDRAGNGYVLTASSGSLTADSSASFSVVVGPASKVVYTTQPSGVVAGAPISPAVVVTVQDAGGNTVTSSSATVTLAPGTNPAGGVLSGSTSVVASSGVATFSDLSINRSSTSPYTLSATSTGLTAATSTSFVVSPGAATQVGYTQQPGGGTGGVAWSTQPKVAIQDSLGNTVTSSTASVTATISSGTAGAVLSCTANPRTAVAGLATFASCKIDKPGTYVLTASSGSLTADSSASFSVVVGPASKVVYTTQPSGVVAGAPISPAVVVTVQDAGGNTVTSSSATVTLAPGTNPAGGVLSGSTSVVASSGVATFSDLSINRSSTSPYTLSATSTGLTAATSTSFVVSPGAATQVGYTQQPGGGTGGVAWSTQPKVAIQDSLGNTVTSSTASVTATISSGTAGAVLSCTANPRTAVAGLATFASCKIDKPGTYVLTASSGSLTADSSASFSVVVGPASKVVYTTQPSGVVAGAPISPAVVVTVQDAGGNTVTTSSATVTLAPGTNPAGGVLSGSTSVVASSGVATFSDLSINRSSTSSYTLAATSTGLSTATSTTFVVSPGAATQVGYAAQPGGGTGGVAWGTQPKVAIQDSLGNTVTSSSASVALSIVSGTGTAGATLTCTNNPKAAVSGVVTFAGCKIDLAGTGYKLNATSAGLGGVLSALFNVS